MDLLAVVVASLILVPLTIFWGGNPVSLVLGLILALFSPGYSLVSAVFPKRDDLDLTRRLALSFGLSIAVVPLMGFVLNFSPWGISLYPVLIALLVFIIACAGIAYYRRRRLPAGERFAPRFCLSLAGFRGREHLWDRILLVVLAVVIIGAIGTLVYVARPPATDTPFTEFYLLGPEGRAENYPDVIVLGEETTVILGVVNQEQKTTDYRVRIVVGGHEVKEIESIILAHQEEWEQRVSFAPVEAGEERLVEFRLYADGAQSAFHVLEMWVDVVDSQ